MSAAAAAAGLRVACCAALSASSVLPSEPAVNRADGRTGAAPTTNRSGIMILGNLSIGRAYICSLGKLKVQRKKLPLSMELTTSVALGLLFGSLIAWLALRSSSAALRSRLSFAEKEL